MVYTKEKFKELWESNEDGGGISFGDCADCAEEWGLYSRPRCARPDEVVYDVCKAAGVSSEEMPLNPREDEEYVTIAGTPPLKGDIYAFKMDGVIDGRKMTRNVVEMLTREECEAIYDRHKEDTSDFEGVFLVKYVGLDGLVEFCNSNDVDDYWIQVF